MNQQELEFRRSRITEEVVDWASERFIIDVEQIHDDPSDLLHPERDEEPAEFLARYRRIGAALGLDWDAVAADFASPNEIARLARIESGAIKPAPLSEGALARMRALRAQRLAEQEEDR